MQLAWPSNTTPPKRFVHVNPDKSIEAGSDYGIHARFITDSNVPLFTDRVSMLATFIKTRMPVFVHARNGVKPLSVDSYLHQCVAHNTKTNADNNPAALAKLFGPNPAMAPEETELKYFGTISDGFTATAYIIVREAMEPIYVNYTDFCVYVFYPPCKFDIGVPMGRGAWAPVQVDFRGGWTHITLRLNNQTSLLDSVWFPNYGWIRNLDLNYSNLIVPDTDNPLKIIKRPNGSTKLHVYVDQYGSVSPTFPDDAKENKQIIDDGKWGFVMDSGVKQILVQADMVRDDEESSRSTLR